MSVNSRIPVVTLILIVVSLLAACGGAGLQKDSKLAEGARLYSLHCVACHGEEGNGGVGVPLALRDFLNTATDDYLHKTIRLGRPGRIMPAFSELSEPQISSIVTHIRGWDWGSSSVEYSAEPVTGNPKRGRRLFAKYCAYCHGQNAEGGRGTGVTFSRPRSAPILAPALNNPGFLAAASDQMIKATLIKGRSGTPMSSAKEKRMSKKDVNDVVHFLRTLENRPPEVNKQADQDIQRVINELSMFSFDETLSRLKTAIKRKGYQILREHTLDEGLAEAGSENRKQWVINFANFRLINDSLTRDPRMGLFLPGRISLVEKDGKVNVMAASPLMYIDIFSNNTLTELGKEMHHFYTAVIGEATSS